MNYSEILSRAWQIIWKHKVLWIFGILAGCANSGGGGAGSGNNFRSTGSGQTPPQLQSYVDRMEQFFKSVPEQTWIMIAIGALLVILVLFVLKIFLSTIGTIGLIRGAQLADQDMEARLTFGELFKGSLPYFWRVFLLNLLVGLVFLVVGLIIAAGVVLGAVLTFGLILICLLPLLCLLVPIGVVVGVVIEQATIAIVVENLGVLDGLRRGWEVVKTNVGPMIVMWLILGLGISGIIGLPMILVLAPFLIGLFANAQRALETGLVVSLVCCAAYLPVLIVLSGILQSYVSSAWTLTFLRLTKPAQLSPEPLPEPLPEQN